MLFAKRPVALILLSCGFAAAQPAPLRGHDPSKIQVLLLTGYNSTPNHRWREIDASLREILERTGRFEVRVEEEPVGITGDTLAAYQLLVIDYSDYIPQLGPVWPAETRQAYLSYLKRGGGVVGFHVTVGSFPEWPEFHKTLGIAANEDIGHSPYHIFTVRAIASPAWPGVPVQFQQWGEIYHGLKLLPGARILGTAWDDPKNCVKAHAGCGSGRDEPVLWTYRYGAGRVFVTTLGHGRRSISTAEFQTSFARGAEWAAKMSELDSR